MNVPFTISAPTTAPHSVQGHRLPVTGVVNFLLSDEQHDTSSNLQFYVTPDFALQCDGIFGLYSLQEHDFFSKPSAVLSLLMTSLTTL